MSNDPRLKAAWQSLRNKPDKWLMWLLVVLLLVSNGPGEWFQPALEFEADIYVLDRSSVCPGTTLEWTDRVEVRRQNGIVMYATSVRDVDRQTVVSDITPEYDILDDRVPDIVTRQQSFSVPDLPPGSYEVVHAAHPTAVHGASDSYIVPFDVREGCPAAEGQAVTASVPVERVIVLLPLIRDEQTERYCTEGGCIQ